MTRLGTRDRAIDLLEPASAAERTSARGLRRSPATLSRLTPRDPWAVLARLAIALSALGVVAFMALRALAPVHWMGFDEAYYLGIGADLLAGRGLRTVFGDVAAIHSPLWPLVLQVPATALRIEPSAWGHPLVIASAGVVIGMTAWFAWRSVRIAAPLAAASMLAYPFLVDLAGWMGLDLPAAALTMVYVGLGIAAVRRGSFSLGLVAGLVFAAAFLVKELALPFAPVPILAGLVRSTRVTSLGRAAAGILLAATLGTSWWFVLYALTVGGVYRLGTATWTLVPIGVAALALVALGSTVGRIVPRTGQPLGPRAARRVAALGWALTVAWTLLLAIYFAVAPNPIGTTLLDVTQLRATLARSAPDHMPLVAIAIPGAALALIARWSRTSMTSSSPQNRRDVGLLDLLRPDDALAIDDLVVATIVGIPFIFLVIAVGEGPRHYIASLGFLAALGAIGWARAIEWIIRGRRIAARAVVTAVAMVLLSAGGVVATGSFMPSAPTATDVTRAAVVETTTTWIRQNLPRGAGVVFGAGLGMETGLGLVGDYRLAQVYGDTSIHADPGGPVGLRASDGSRPGDWVALWTDSRDATSVYGLRASSLLGLIRRANPAIWIETDPVTPQAPSEKLEMLDLAQGVERIAEWSWPWGAGRLETVVYRVDPSRVSFSGDVVSTPAALARIVAWMERDATAYRRAASDLLDRLRVAAPAEAASALMGRLRAIAGR